MPTPGDNTGRHPGTLRTLAVFLALPAPDAADALETLIPDHPWLTEAVAELRGLSPEQWQAEYTQLFISGYPRTTCPPFESAYRHGVLEGPATAELEVLYRNEGFRATDMPADYLGTMLDFAAWLLETRRGPDTSLWNAIWDDHLAAWVPHFAEDLRKHSRLVFYRLVGQRLLELFPVEQTVENHA